MNMKIRLWWYKWGLSCRDIPLIIIGVLIGHIIYLHAYYLPEAKAAACKICKDEGKIIGVAEFKQQLKDEGKIIIEELGIACKEERTG